jgi:hypothetical protein
LFTSIRQIENLSQFKKEIFNGKIFVFQKSQITEQLIDQIKKKIQINYSGQLEKLHHLSNCEELSADLIANLKNTEIFKKLFYDFLISINFLQGESYWDKFVVRVAPAKNEFGYREASRIGVHRDTWGTNIYQQINWWAPISSIEKTNTMVFFPEYFDKPVKNSTATWDLNIYLENRKKGDFSYPSAPELLEDLPENLKIWPVTIKPGEILCFSGSHLHSSSKDKSENTRFSYEIRTICQNDFDEKNEAPNVDCKLQWQFPKIFRNMKDNSPMKMTS